MGTDKPEEETVKAKKQDKPKLEALCLEPAASYHDIGPERLLCQECKRGAKEADRSKFVPKGYTKRLLLVFGAPPTKEEVGLAYDIAEEAGYGRLDVAYISAVRCSGDDPGMTEIRCCRPFVLRAVDFLDPGLVVALGPAASRSLTNSGTATNVTKLRGRSLIVAGRDVKAYVTYPPSAVLAGGVQYRIRIVEDLKRVGQTEVPYPEDKLPVPGNIVSVDTEYAPDGSLLTLGIADTHSAVSKEVTEARFTALIDSLNSEYKGSWLVGHSLTGDLDHLIKLGAAQDKWVSGEKTLDSLLLERMNDENRGRGGYELESLMTSGRNVTPWKYHTKAYDEKDATTWPVDLRRERCRLDAWASAVVASEAWSKAVNSGVPIELTHKIASSLHRIELAGVYIDKAKYSEIGTALQADSVRYKDQLMKLAYAHGMESFSPTKDNDIRTLLFDKLKLKVVHKTEKGAPSVDKTTLKQYIGIPGVDLLLKFNEADKALSTNITGISDLIQDVHDDPKKGYLPVHINPLGARTGRRSSEKPNMQNWAPGLRQIVVSRYPNGSILEFDYKSLEVFLLAFVSKDEKLYDYFATRGGYIAVAKDMWGTSVEKGTKEYKATKSIVLGTNYNMQTPLMAKNLWLMGVHFSADFKQHEAKVDRLRNKYLDMFPGLRRHFAAQKRYLLRYQEARTLTGRIRHLPLSGGEETPGFYGYVNQAINFPVQGLAADVTGSALIDCEQVICNYVPMTLMDYHSLVLTKDWVRWPVPLIINEVHDSLVFDLPYPIGSKEATDMAMQLKGAMEQVRTLRDLVPEFTVPLSVEMKTGHSWGMSE